MGSLVLELQQEVLKHDCDILIALRKAHVVAVKLKLTEFDSWIQKELHGYQNDVDTLPEYRKMRGDLKANNPVRGWMPVIVTGENNLSFSIAPITDSLASLIHAANTSHDGQFYYSYPPTLAMKICKQAGISIYMEIAIFIGIFRITNAIEEVKNTLLEWTLKLEENGILGENMTFNAQETASAQEIPQQISYYLAPVFQGDVINSSIITGDNSTVNYNKEVVLQTVEKIRESVQNEEISEEDKETAIELLEEISDKIENDKKPDIVKAALDGMKSFLISTGAEATTALMEAAMQGLF